MATLSQLVTAIATAEGIDAERVTAISRAVREDGLIRTSGRGTSAAQMDEQDAANLLIAANTAETARTASAVVKKYRELQAKRRPSQFGGELEEMIASAKRECLGDYLIKMVAILGTRGHILGRKKFSDETYRLRIEFERPVPNVMVEVATSNISRPDFISFADRRLPIAVAQGDRRDRTRITERTILAVANALRT